MGDIADILGLAPKGAPVDETAAILNDKVKKTTVTKKKPKGMSREVFDLVGSDSFVSSVQSNPQVSGFKSKRASVLKGKWIWDSIKNSARTDKDQVTFFHWVKADVSYPDYPYAKFNIALDEISLTREQYDAMAQDNTKWSYEDTLNVLTTCHKFALRWPVIYDRIQLSTPKRIEEIQARYYQVQAFQTNGSFKFNLERETNRRLQQDLLFKKTKEDEIEEAKLREELKNIDAALKKYKKLVKPAPAVAIKSEPKASADGKALSETASSSSSTAAAPLPPIVVAPAHVVVDHTPAPGRPCLQSGRLQSGDAGLSKNLIKKVNSYLTQLNLPAKPAATRSVCDMMDAIRRDTATLLSLHSSIAKREKDKTTNALAGTGAGGAANVTIKTEKKTSKANTGAASGAGTAGAAGGAAATEPKPKKASTKRKSGTLDEKPADAVPVVDSASLMPSDLLMGVPAASGMGGVSNSSSSSVTATAAPAAGSGGNKAKKVCV